MRFLMEITETDGPQLSSNIPSGRNGTEILFLTIIEDGS